MLATPRLLPSVVRGVATAQQCNLPVALLAPQVSPQNSPELLLQHTGLPRCLQRALVDITTTYSLQYPRHVAPTVPTKSRISTTKPAFPLYRTYYKRYHPSIRTTAAPRVRPTAIKPATRAAIKNLLTKAPPHLLLLLLLVQPPSTQPPSRASQRHATNPIPSSLGVNFGVATRSSTTTGTWSEPRYALGYVVHGGVSSARSAVTWMVEVPGSNHT